jgi:hypothetical protein
MEVAKYTIHPVALKFPELPPDEFEALKESIRKHGLFEPIIVNGDGVILDGRHRYQACLELNRPPMMFNFADVKGADNLSAEEFIFDSNMKRRHLSESQRAAVAAEFANMRQGERTDLEPCNNCDKVSQEKAGELLKVSRGSVSRAKKVKAKNPEAFNKVKNGEVSLNAAVKSVEAEEKVTSWSATDQQEGSANDKKSDKTKPQVARDHISVTAKQFHAAVNARVQEFLENTIGPKMRAEQAEARRIMDSRKGVMDRKTYRKILSCLHPDRVMESELKPKYEEAFRLFTFLEKRLLDEKDSPTQFVDLPKTRAEWDELRRQVANRKKHSRRGSLNSIERRSPNETCEVGWLLLTTERDMAISALTPGNEKWKEAALAFFESLRSRKIITVS